MKQSSQQHAFDAASDSDDYLDTDDEVNEFESGMPMEVEDDDLEDQGIAQWEPDSWDVAASADHDDEDGEDAVQHHLSSMPLSTLAKARSKMDKVSKYQKGESSQAATLSALARDEQEKRRDRIESRDSKHAPTALSAKKQVSRFRQVVDMPKVVRRNERRDPRFSSISAGNVDPHLHQQSYGFVSDMYQEEMAQLKQSLTTAVKAERSCSLKDKAAWAEERAKLERQIVQTKTKLDRTAREKRDRETLASAKKAEREKRAQGKGAWHMKKGAQRDLLLKSRFDALEASGGKMAVKKALDKKRKKVASKEKKSRPRL